MTQPDPDKALRYNDEKPRIDRVLLFDSALNKLAAVMSQGAVKYPSDRNWLKGGKPDEEYIASALRHMQAHQNGEFYDPDIGTSHIANAMWNLGALLRCNYDDSPDLDPEFDQQAFEEKYKDPQ